MARKGFPESYDVRRLVEFMTGVKTGQAGVRAPVYSHQAYDIIRGEYQVVDRPDIVIVEGLNVLQTGETAAGRPARVFVSDFFDFSIYIDADEQDIEAWYVERFLTLRSTVFQDARSYFHRYASLSDAEAVDTAREIWRSINGVNLRENIRPTRERARLVFEKGADHAIRRVRLRRIYAGRGRSVTARRSSHFRLASSRAARRDLGVFRLRALVLGLGEERRHGHALAPIVDGDEREIGETRLLALAGERALPRRLRPRPRATCGTPPSRAPSG